MSFWKNLFGGGSGGGSDAGGGGGALGPGEEYKGFMITPVAMSAGSEYQLAGRIEKDVGGEVKRHEFVRADRFASKDDAAAMAISKGRQIIDEQGERLFQQSWPSKPN
jgi:hypothetical protein